ncbi:MAG TPA: pilus assembly protein PilM [Solirubrobacteraceae bacterium]|nr:pilus assembly protein PilM [Solirubrobacteraceae bacterium]
MRITTLLPGGRFRRATRRAGSAVSLDIGADAIVALQSAGDGARLRQAIVHPLPPGLVVDGEVVDSEGLAAQLGLLFSEHKLPREVRVGLAHPRLMVRLVELPATISGRDLDSAVRHLATDHLPVGLDQLVVDYRCVGRVPGSAGGGLQRILMAAARMDGIERLTRALESAGLHLQGISLSGMAMVTALENEPLPGEAMLYVQAGALTNVVITEDGEPLLVRAASAGSESIATGLAERSGITHEEARSYVSTLGLAAAPRHGSPAAIPEELQSSVSQQVREGLRRVVAEVQSSRGVYAARPDACPIGAVVLTGSMTTWPGVVQALEDDLHLPVIVAGRENWPRLEDVGVPAERLDVVVGLSRTSSDARPDLRPAAIKAEGRAATPMTQVAQVGCAALAVLAAAIVYLVVISNQVSTGREQLGTISAALVESERQAAELKPYDDFAKATLARRDAVTSVAKTRFNWDRALTELAQVGPGGVWLTSVSGTLTPESTVDGGAGGGSGLRSALPGPALELEGCALREGKVPAYIDRLRAITGVTEVGFSRSERLEKAAAKPGSGPARPNSGAGAGSGDCRNGDEKTAQFSLVAYFKASAALQASTAAAASPAAPAASGQPAAPNTGGPTTTPTAPPTQTASTATGDSK